MMWFSTAVCLSSNKQWHLRHARLEHPLLEGDRDNDSMLAVPKELPEEQS
jgi:hypothetical protein